MRRAIKRICGHCQREMYFDASARIKLETISNSSCIRCGHRGAVIALDVELPADVEVWDHIPDG